MLSYVHTLSDFVWRGENDSNTLRVDAYFFEKGEKNLSFQEYPGTCERGQGTRRRINFKVSGKLSTYPSPKLTLTLTSHLGQNDGLGEG